MCISIPAKVLKMGDRSALVEIDGMQREVLLAPGIIKCGWVLIHSGIAVAMLEEDEALDMRALLDAARGKQTR